MIVPVTHRFEPVVQASPSLIPDGFIYLRATPDICMNRLKRRQRTEEGGVTLDYLMGLHQKHEDWLSYDRVPPIMPPFAPQFPAVEYQCQGQTLPGNLSKGQHNLRVTAVTEPKAIQGKVSCSCTAMPACLCCLHSSLAASSSLLHGCFAPANVACGMTCDHAFSTSCCAYLSQVSHSCVQDHHTQRSRSVCTQCLHR